MQKATILSFKYTTSKGRDTYDYNIVTLYANGEKVARTCGGGYDMRGKVLGTYIKDKYIERLKELKGNTGSLDDGTGYYGLSYWKEVDGKYTNIKQYEEGASISLDGACGENCIVGIANAIGINLESVLVKPNEWGYILTDNRA